MPTDNYRAVTCARAHRLTGQAPRHYGYTILINPPMKLAVEGDDIEGIGWVPRPRTETVPVMGWYRFKADARQRAALMNDHARRTGKYFHYALPIPPCPSTPTPS